MNSRKDPRQDSTMKESGGRLGGSSLSCGSRDTAGTAWTRGGPGLLPLLLLLLGLAAGCLPSQVRRLNTLGDKASADGRYKEAITFYSRSLALEPDQGKIRLRLDSAQVLLRQIYVDKIYELVDSPRAPIGEFLTAWEMSAALPSLKVDKPRIASIRLDLARRFTKAEPTLRARTEGHNYYMHLAKMLSLVREGGVLRTLAEVGATLQAEHEQAKAQADRARRPGLALLHATAAARFAPRATGLWAEVSRRRQALLRTLEVPLALRVSAKTSAAAQHLEGGLRRRIPPIFALTRDAPLVLTLRVGSPSATQREATDRLSARCQVGTKKEPNPLYATLERRAETARRRFESEQRSLEEVSRRCAAEQRATACTSYVSSARSDLASAKREVDRLDSQLATCPRTVDKPVYRVFFYTRRTLYRQATLAGDLTVIKDNQVVSSRGVSGASRDQDTYGDGLSCARISPEPLQIKATSLLVAEARQRLLDSCTGELSQLRRRLARQQLAGGDSRDERLDALVRARLVDGTFKLAREELRTSLASAWGTDFTITQRILR